jgi:hypothetical protein
MSFAANPGRKDRRRGAAGKAEGAASSRRGGPDVESREERSAKRAHGTRRVTDADKPPRWHTPATGR